MQTAGGHPGPPRPVLPRPVTGDGDFFHTTPLQDMPVALARRQKTLSIHRRSHPIPARRNQWQRVPPGSRRPRPPLPARPAPNPSLLRPNVTVSRGVFARDRVGNVADQRECGHLGESIHDRRRWIRHDEHVGLVGRLPATDAGPVKTETICEAVFLKLGDRRREMLRKIGRLSPNWIFVFVAVPSRQKRPLRH